MSSSPTPEDGLEAQEHESAAEEEAVVVGVDLDLDLDASFADDQEPSALDDVAEQAQAPHRAVATDALSLSAPPEEDHDNDHDHDNHVPDDADEAEVAEEDDVNDPLRTLDLTGSLGGGGDDEVEELATDHADEAQTASSSSSAGPAGTTAGANDVMGDGAALVAARDRVQEEKRRKQEQAAASLGHGSSAASGAAGSAPRARNRASRGVDADDEESQRPVGSGMFFRSGRFDTTRYLGKAWTTLFSNKLTFAKLEFTWAIISVVFITIVFIVLSFAEMVLGIDDRHEDEDVLELVDLERDMHSPLSAYVFDVITEYSISVFLVYPLVMSFFHGVFHMIRGGTSAAERVEIYDHSRFADERPAGPPLLDYSECFSHLPTSARRSFPFRIGSLLYLGRFFFTLVDYIFIAGVMAEADDVLVIIAKVLSWIPYLYYCLLSLLVLCYHLEYPSWSTARVFGVAFERVWDRLGDCFWYLMLCLVLITIGTSLEFVGLLFVVPLLLLSVAFSYDHIEGVRGAEKEEDMYFDDRRAGDDL